MSEEIKEQKNDEIIPDDYITYLDEEEQKKREAERQKQFGDWQKFVKEENTDIVNKEEMPVKEDDKPDKPAVIQLTGNESEDVLKLLKELDQKNDAHLRLFAEFDNFKKRNQKITRAMYRDGVKDLAKEVCSVLDTFDRAVKATQDEAYIAGLKGMKKQLFTVLQNFGVEEIESVGEEFDPKYHNAVHQMPVAGLKPGTIVEEVVKGYKIETEVLRHADVVVAGKSE